MDKKQWRENGIDLLYDLAGAFLQAVGMWCFIEPSHIAPGGASGIALIISFLSQMSVGLLTFLLNIPLLLASFLMLDRRMTWKTVRTVFWSSVVLDLVVAPIFPQYAGDRLIASAFGGITAGVGMALVFMRNSTTGGGDILAKLLQKKYPYMQTGYAIMLIDFVVIGISAVVFRDMDAVLYGIVAMVCTTQAIDIILYGLNRGSMIIIHSAKNQEIAAEIMKDIGRGTTFYKIKGGYSGQEGEALMCVVDRKQFYLVKRIVDYYDPRAFVIVSETKEVYGEGFIE